MNLHFGEEFSSQWWSLIIHFYLSNIFSSWHLWIFVIRIIFHSHWCCSSISFHYIKNCIVVMDVYYRDTFASWLGIFIVMLNLFYSDKFSSWWWMFISVMIFNHCNVFLPHLWVFLIMMYFYFGNEFSSLQEKLSIQMNFITVSILLTGFKFFS